MRPLRGRGDSHRAIHAYVRRIICLASKKSYFSYIVLMNAPASWEDPICLCIFVSKGIIAKVNNSDIISIILL